MKNCSGLKEIFNEEMLEWQPGRPSQREGGTKSVQSDLVSMQSANCGTAPIIVFQASKTEIQTIPADIQMLKTNMPTSAVAVHIPRSEIPTNEANVQILRSEITTSAADIQIPNIEMPTIAADTQIPRVEIATTAVDASRIALHPCCRYGRFVCTSWLVCLVDFGWETMSWTYRCMVVLDTSAARPHHNLELLGLECDLWFRRLWDTLP